MNHQQSPETEFARRLRAELTAIIAERGAAQAAHVATSSTTTKPVWRRRNPRLVFASAAATALAALALIISASGSDTPAAFAVEAQPEGEVTVEIRSLEDAKGLEEALDAAGVPSSVNYLAAGMTCKQPRFQPVPWPEGTRAIKMAKITGDGPFTFSGPLRFSISSDAVAPGQTLVITASASAEGLFGAGTDVEIAEGAVAPCEPVQASGDEAAAARQGSSGGR
jgi:hypothetical protein